MSATSYITPPEVIDPDAAWDMSAWPSRCPLEDFNGANRLDPFWSAVWESSTAGWINSDTITRQRDLFWFPTALSLSRDAGLDSFFSDYRFISRLALLGSLHSWRTMTVEQAAALIGEPSLASIRRKSITAMFAAGLLDIGAFTVGIRTDTTKSRSLLLRPARGESFAKNVAPRLTWAEWVAVTGGQKWFGGNSFDRHNVLATELALRLSEYTDIEAVFGESFSSMDLLAGTGAGLQPIVTNKAADLTAVRADGARVAIEMTASVSKGFVSKVRQWAEILQRTAYEDTGLSVVFVITPPEGANIRSIAYGAILSAVREFPGPRSNPTGARMGITTWPTWFPRAHAFSDDFIVGRAHVPTGPNADPWQTRDFFDPFDTPFEARDSAKSLAVLDNAKLLGQTPHWMRDPEAYPLWEHLLSDAGLPGIPVPTGYRSDEVKVTDIFATRGVATGRAKPRRRLRGLVPTDPQRAPGYGTQPRRSSTPKSAGSTPPSDQIADSA